MNIKESLIKLFLDNHIIGYKPEGLILKSGRKSFWYANCRSLTLSFYDLLEVAEIVTSFIKFNFLMTEFDAVIGVPEGATLIGNKVHEKMIESFYSLHHKIFQLRVVEKLHGDIANKFWVNGNVPEKVILIEDVTTTAGSVLDLAFKLQSMGVEIVGILSLFNRMELDNDGKTVEQKMEEHGFKYFSIINASDILQLVIDGLPEEERQEAKTKINSDFSEMYSDKSPINLT